MLRSGQRLNVAEVLDNAIREKAHFLAQFINVPVWDSLVFENPHQAPLFDPPTP